MEGLQSAEALDFAGVNRVDFTAAHKRGLVPWAPPTVNGVARVFTMDELIAAYCLGQLLERLIVPRHAYKIATDIHRQIKKDRGIRTLSAWKITGRNGKARVEVSDAAPKHDAIELFRFEVAKIRQLAAAGIAAKQQHSE